MKRIFAPGESVRVRDHKSLKHISGSIYLDTENGMAYRIAGDEVMTMHGDLEFALFSERQYLQRQMEQITAETEPHFRRSPGGGS